MKLNYENMQTVCPITDKRINENVARLNAFITVLLVLSFLILKSWFFLVILIGDFFIRGFIDSRYSLICIISKWITQTLNIKGKLINAGPKIFAAQVGLVFSVVSLLSLLLHYNIFTLVFVGVLGVFSFLESAFGFCVACKLYPFFRKIS